MNTLNLDDLTLGQVKELKKLLIADVAVPATKTGFLGECYIGKYVICRSRNEGVNAGKVIALDETGIILADARRLYYHKPLDTNISWYEGVALSGVSKDSRLGPPVEKIIIEDYSLTICEKDAEQSIREATTNAQS